MYKRSLSLGAVAALAILATTSFSTASQAKCTTNWVHGDCGPAVIQNHGGYEAATGQHQDEWHCCWEYEMKAARKPSAGEQSLG